MLGSARTRVVRAGPTACRVTWPRLGVAVDFGLIGSDQRDPCKAGGAFVVTVTGRARVADRGRSAGRRSRRTAPRLYPSALTASPDIDGRAGYWLVTRRLCREVGGGAYPGLFARVDAGRVSALVVSVGICD